MELIDKIKAAVTAELRSRLFHLKTAAGEALISDPGKLVAYTTRAQTLHSYLSLLDSVACSEAKALRLFEAALVEELPVMSLSDWTLILSSPAASEATEDEPPAIQIPDPD